MRGKRGKRLAAVVIAAALVAASLVITLCGAWDNIFYALGYKENINDGNTLTAAFLNVGAADCCVLSCGGKTALIDAGDNLGKDSCVKYLRKNGIEKIDLAILSHFDSDHCAELENIIKVSKIKRLVLCSAFKGSADGESIVSSARAAGSDIEYKSAGEALELGKMTITLLSPTGDEYGSDNDNSLVCKACAFGKSILFTGDAGEGVERDLIAAGADIDCDILKVAHHGSKTGSGEEFIASVSPKYAVVSVGENNYGLPSNRVIKRLESHGALVLRTDKNGNIIFELSDKGISVRADYG